MRIVRMPPTLLFAATLLLLNSVAFGEPKSWLFTSLLREKQIVAFERDPASGRLIRRTVTNCSAEPAGMALSRDRRFLFVALRSVGELASYEIDWESGRLKLVEEVAAGADPAFLLPERSGRYLLAAFYEANQVTIHRVSNHGYLSKSVQTVPTAPRAHGIAIDSKNQRVYVPHTGANRIYQFRLDLEEVRLRPLDPPFLTTPKEDEPRHLVLHPNDRFAYTSNEKGDSLGVYRIDAASGQLSRTQTESTIPANFDGSKNSTSRCEMTPDGRFVFVANRGHDSLAGFAIQSDGRVKRVSITPTEPTPRSFSISPDGRFLYAAGQSSGRIAAYRIDDSGRLDRFAMYEAGPVAWWVLAADPP